jgi:hypothetical protein
MLKAEGTAMLNKRSIFSNVSLFTAANLLAIAPVQAQNLGLTADQLVEQITAASNTAGKTLRFEQHRCAENPKPGDNTQKVISCLYRLGERRTLITNAEPEGSLLNISTRPWDGGEGSSGALIISWIAATINGNEPVDWDEAADSLLKTAAADGVGGATMGRVDFTVLDSNGKLTIGATPNSAAASQ